MLLRIFLVVTLALAAAATRAGTMALTGATLVDGTGAEPVDNAVVLIDGDRITCAGSRDACAVDDATHEIVHLDGRYITPGLVDAHVHYSQTGWVDSRPDSIDVRDRYPYADLMVELRRNPGRWHRSYLCSGITAVFDVGGYPWTWEVAGTACGGHDAPHFAAAGPLLSTVEHWVNLPGEKQFVYLDDAESVRRAVEYVAANGGDAVKLWFIPSLERGFESTRELAMLTGRAADETGLRFIVHATGLKEARAAVQAGADILVHSVTDKRVDPDFIDALTGSNAIYIPTLTVHQGYYRLYRSALSGEPPAVDDPNGCVDPLTLSRVNETPELGGRLRVGRSWLDTLKGQQDEATRIMAHNLLALRDAGVTIATGTDAGNPLTLHGPAIHTEMEAMEAAGMPPMEIIVASTRNGARAMGRADELGTIEAGKAADLLVLASDPTETVAGFRDLDYVMRAGVLMRQNTLRPAP